MAWGDYGVSLCIVRWAAFSGWLFRLDFSVSDLNKIKSPDQLFEQSKKHMNLAFRLLRSPLTRSLGLFRSAFYATMSTTTSGLVPSKREVFLLIVPEMKAAMLTRIPNLSLQSKNTGPL